MNIRMSNTHLKTLTKLYEMTEKHNCTISFGQNNDSNTDLDNDLLEERANMPSKLLYEFTGMVLENTFSQNSSYYFTLYDKTNKTYHTLSLHEAMTSCFFDESDTDSEELLEWLEDYSHESWLSDKYFCYNTSYQVIQGFDNVDKTNINVYREGMLLKFFGDLVCDYLGEERIQEVY